MTDQPNQDRRRKKSPDPTPVWLAEGSYPRKILEEKVALVMSSSQHWAMNE
jgi:hypothetical protein